MELLQGKAGKWRTAWSLLLLLAPSLSAQVLIKRDPGRTDCPDTHLRLTARRPDGSPATALRAQDLYLWFSMGSADVRSLQSEEPAKTGTPDTNVLIVLRPQATGVDAAFPAAVLRNLQAVPNFHWKIAVLAPDGTMTPFFPMAEEAGLHTALEHAVTPNPTARSVAEWSAAERAAFRQLQRRSGRHIIVELAPVQESRLPREAAANPASTANAFAADRTLDFLAQNDMTQIYRLPDVSGMPAAEYDATGGRRAPTINALFRNIVSDAPGSYDVMVHPLFSCQPGASYSLRITSFQKDIQLFYPNALRMATEEPHPADQSR